MVSSRVPSSLPSPPSPPPYCWTIQPCSYMLPPYCHHLPSPSTSGPLPFVTPSSRYPSRATLTRCLGCLGGICSLPPLSSYPMSSICNSSSIKPFSLFPHDTLHKQPWRAALVASVGALVVSSCLAALVIRLFSVLDFTEACLASLFGAVDFSVSF